MNALLFCDLKKKYKKIQKLNKREKEVMFLHFPSLPCILWIVSSLIMSSDDFPAYKGNVGRATSPSLERQDGTGLQVGQGPVAWD